MLCKMLVLANNQFQNMFRKTESSPPFVDIAMSTSISEQQYTAQSHLAHYMLFVTKDMKQLERLVECESMAIRLHVDMTLSWQLVVLMSDAW